MNGRGILGFLLTLLAVGLLVGLGVGIYQMGVAQGIVDAGRFPAGAPVPVGGYGYGYHGGPGIFGILFGLFFLFLVFGLIRAAFSRGRGWGPGWGGGWGRHGYGYGPGWGKGFGPEGGPEAWREERDRRMADLHRKLHESESQDGPSGTGGSGGGPAR
jgi:hypothetical protein